jgi:hypothetical protein
MNNIGNFYLAENFSPNLAFDLCRSAKQPCIIVLSGGDDSKQNWTKNYAKELGVKLKELFEQNKAENIPCRLVTGGIGKIPLKVVKAYQKAGGDMDSVFHILPNDPKMLEAKQSEIEKIGRLVIAGQDESERSTILMQKTNATAVIGLSGDHLTAKEYQKAVVLSNRYRENGPGFQVANLTKYTKYFRPNEDDNEIVAECEEISELHENTLRSYEGIIRDQRVKISTLEEQLATTAQIVGKMLLDKLQSEKELELKDLLELSIQLRSQPGYKGAVELHVGFQLFWTPLNEICKKMRHSENQKSFWKNEWAKICKDKNLLQELETILKHHQLIPYAVSLLHRSFFLWNEEPQIKKLWLDIWGPDVLVEWLKNDVNDDFIKVLFNFDYPCNLDDSHWVQLTEAGMSSDEWRGLTLATKHFWKSTNSQQIIPPIVEQILFTYSQNNKASVTKNAYATSYIREAQIFDKLIWSKEEVQHCLEEDLSTCRLLESYGVLREGPALILAPQTGGACDIESQAYDEVEESGILTKEEIAFLFDNAVICSEESIEATVKKVIHTIEKHYFWKNRFNV